MTITQTIEDRAKAFCSKKPLAFQPNKHVPLWMAEFAQQELQLAAADKQALEQRLSEAKAAFSLISEMVNDPQYVNESWSFKTGFINKIITTYSAVEEKSNDSQTS